jgi:tight adherence protein C
MPIFLAIFLFVAVLTLTAGFGYYYYARPSRLLDQLNDTSQFVPRTAEAAGGKGEGVSVAALLKTIGTLLPVSPQDDKLLKQDLMFAGIRSANAMQVFYGLKLVLAFSFMIAGLLLRDHVANPMLRTITPVAGAGIGYMMPGLLLARMIKKRNAKVRMALPDVLDLLVVCTEAGCGLDQAMVNVSRELKTVHPDMAEELTLVNMEIMAGTSRAEALRNLGRRSDEDEIKKLVNLLVQTDRFGTSIAQSLRTQSDYLRIRRRQEAEEKAGKVGVKLVFPIFFFCLPSLLVVTAGPGILQLIRDMGALAASHQ